MSATTTALMALLGWWFSLILVLAAMRTAMTFSGAKQANQFAADGSDLAGFGQRLTRVHANNYENIPIFAALLVYAVAAGQTAVTDGLASWLVVARVGQGIVHLISTSVPMVMIRFALYLAQLLIVASWIVRFLE